MTIAIQIIRVDNGSRHFQWRLTVIFSFQLFYPKVLMILWLQELITNRVEVLGSNLLIKITHCSILLVYSLLLLWCSSGFIGFSCKLFLVFERDELLNTVLCFTSAKSNQIKSNSLFR